MLAKSETERHTPAGTAVTQLILGIFRANGRLLRAGDALAGDLKLTAARWQVLGAISEAPKTVAQIARDFELTRQGVLWVVQSLEKDGIVELIDNPDHRRAKLVRPTASGQAIYEEVSRRQTIWANELGGSFKLDELEKALSVIEKLGQLGRRSAASLGDD